MSNQSTGQRVETELARAVSSGVLPDDVHARADQLLNRLRQPVRIAVMGLPGTGKSTIVNLLLGSEILQEGISLPTLQIQHAAETETICTLPDGSKQSLPSFSTNEIAALSPVFVEINAPLPALAKISVLEVVAPNDANALHKASQWAAKRSDVALWCTNGFDQTEQQVWAQMPDLMKDHAFLMVTKADLLRDQNTFDSVMYTLHTVAKDEFAQIIPIETRNAVAARRADGTVDKDMMRDSGGIALIKAVLRQVELGKQSTVDQAEILLQQHQDILQRIPDEAPEEAQAPEPAPVADIPNEPQTDHEGLDRLKAIAERAKIAKATPPAAIMTSPVEIAPSMAPAAAVPVAEQATAPAAKTPADVVSLKPATRAAYEKVVAYVEDQSLELVAAIKDMGDSAPSEVMMMAVEHIQWLCDYLNENGDESDVALQRARDTAFDAADLVQLMQMEKQDSAALEAIKLMLQIKRELQADLAA